MLHRILKPKNSQAADTQAELDNERQRADAAVAAARDREVQLSAVRSEVNELREEVTQLKAARANLVREAEYSAEKVSLEASRMMGSLGVPPVELETDAGLVNHWQKMAKLGSVAKRRAYFQKHREVMEKDMRGEQR